MQDGAQVAAAHNGVIVKYNEDKDRKAGG